MKQLVTSRAPGADPGGETPKSAAPLVRSGDAKKVCFFLQIIKNDAVFVWFAVLLFIYVCNCACNIVFRCGWGGGRGFRFSLMSFLRFLLFFCYFGFARVWMW